MAKGVQRNDTQRKMKFTKEVIGMALILFSVLSLMCLVAGQLIYPIGEIVSGFYLGVFGYYSFVFLAIVIYLGLCMLLSKSLFKGKMLFALIAVNVLLLAVTSFVQLLTFKNWQPNLLACLSSAFCGGNVGFGECTFGGVFATLINYPLLLVLNKVGVALIFAAVMAICAIALFFTFKPKNRGVQRVKKPVNKKEKTVKSYDGSAQKQQSEPSNFGEPDFEPVNEQVAKKAPSGLYVFGNDGFFAKTERDKKREKSNGARSGNNYNVPFNRSKFPEELVVEQPQRGYVESYGQDLDEKLKYVKTPPRVDLDDLNQSPTGINQSPNDNYSNFVSSNSRQNSAVVNKRSFSVDNDEQEATDRTMSSFNTARDNFRRSGNSFEESRSTERRFDRNTAAVGSASFGFRPDGRRSDIRRNDNADFGGAFSSARIDDIDDWNNQGLDDIAVVKDSAATSSTAQPFTAAKPDVRSGDFNGRDDFGTRDNFSNRNDFGARDSFAKSGDINGQVDSNEQNIGRSRAVDAMENSTAERFSQTTAPKTESDGVSGVRGASPISNRTEKTANAASKTKAVEVEEEKPNPYDIRPINAKYKFPPLALLRDYTPDPAVVEANHKRQLERAKIIVEKYKQNKINVEIKDVILGSSVTRFVLSIPDDVSIKAVESVQKDLNFRLGAASDIRYLMPIPGTSYVGIEVPNEKPSSVSLKSVMKCDAFKNAPKDTLTFAFGQDSIGKPITMDIGAMPHLLTAGTTGSGKSVFLQCLLISLFYRYSPDDLRLIIVDPKQVEFSSYRGVPHLMLGEIITEPKKALAMLDWVNQEMARRYEAIRNRNCKKISEYNAKLLPGERKMPFLLVIIDEFAQLIMSGEDKKVFENKVGKLAQLARAAGIHLVIATQRPSADIMDGTIKNNFPSRIAFKMGNSVSSGVVLDQTGAERLLGKGDALYKIGDMPEVLRAQCAFISTEEADSVLDYIRDNNKAYFDEKALEVISKIANSANQDSASEGSASGQDVDSDSIDEMYLRALRQVIRTHNPSKTSLQTKLGIGYPRAAKIVDWMETQGFISPAVDNKQRKVNITKEEYEELFGDFNDDIA